MIKIIITMIIMMMSMGIREQSRGWGRTGGCTITTMGWRRTRTSPYTRLGSSAKGLRRFSPGISKKEPSLLALVDLLALGVVVPPSDCPPLTQGVVVPPSDCLPPTQGVVVPPSDCRPPPRVPRCYPEELLCGRVASLRTDLESVQASARSVIDYLNEKTGSNLSLKEVIRADAQLVAGTLHFLFIKSSEDQIYKAKVYCDLCGNRFVKEVNHVMIRNKGGDGDGNVAVKDDAGKDGDSRNTDVRGKDDARNVNMGMKVPPSIGPSVPPGVRMLRIMHPGDIKSDKVIVLPMRPDNERVQNSARYALACMNHHMGTDLTLVKIVRAKVQLMAGMHFFFTLKASDNRLYKAKVDIDRHGKRSLGYLKLIVPPKTRDNDSHIAVTGYIRPRLTLTGMEKEAWDT